MPNGWGGGSELPGEDDVARTFGHRLRRRIYPLSWWRRYIDMLERRYPRRIRQRPLSEHPVKTAHPWGEDRSWCTKCGAAAICDDVSFTVWHVDDSTPANVFCRREDTQERPTNGR